MQSAAERTETLRINQNGRPGRETKVRNFRHSQKEHRIPVRNGGLPAIHIRRHDGKGLDYFAASRVTSPVQYTGERLDGKA